MSGVVSLDSAALREFWRERHLCTLTTLRADGSPHVVPVGATLDPDAGLLRVTASRTSATHPSRPSQRSGTITRARLTSIPSASAITAACAIWASVLPVLIVTGHAEAIPIPPDLPVLRKPFESVDLAAEVSRLLDRAA